MDQIKSKNQEILALSQELLADIELSRLAPHALLLKSSRLARLVEANDALRSFLEWELRGYPSGDDLAKEWMAWVGRGTGIWTPLAQLAAAIEASKDRLAVLRVPDISIDESVHSANPNQYLTQRSTYDISPAKAASDAVKKVTDDAATVASSIPALSGIVSQVLAVVHQLSQMSTTSERSVGWRRISLVPSRIGLIHC